MEDKKNDVLPLWGYLLCVLVPAIGGLLGILIGRILSN